MRQLNLRLNEAEAGEPSPEGEVDQAGASVRAVSAEDAAPPPSHATHPISALHRLIEERMFAEDARVEPVEVPQDVGEPLVAEGAEGEKPSEKTASPSRLPVRFVKIALGIAVIALFGWVPLQTLLHASSVEAIVNSRIVTVRAPIEGDVVAVPTDISAGMLASNQPLIRIENPRADRSRLDSLNDQLAAAEIEKPTLDAKILATQRAHDVLAAEVASFTAGRVKQLEARTAALTAEINAAEAQRVLAESEAKRAERLARSSTMSTADLERFTQQETVASQTKIAAERQLDAASVELEAARSGSFIGDSYNDMPSSAQRRDDLRQRLDELTAERDAAVAKIARLRASVAEEAGRYGALSDVVVSPPVSGRIWEVMTAPGEHVQAGQDLLKILDCSGAVVTANVTESVYNHLSVGSPARFRPTDGGPDLQGVVTNLTGLAEAAANLAIVPSALNREAYRVTVRVPALASEPSCAIGRTGRVIFDKATAAAQ